MLGSRNFCGEYKRASTSVGGRRSRGGSGSHHDWHPRFAGQSITCRSCRQADGGFASTPSRAYLPALRWRVRQPDRSDRSHPERTQLWLVTTPDESTHDESRARVPWFETNCRAKQKHATPGAYREWHGLRQRVQLEATGPPQILSRCAYRRTSGTRRRRTPERTPERARG
jgi:hypothetical protein